jgi:hypothetical protein
VRLPRKAGKDDHIHHQNRPDIVAAANAKKKKKIIHLPHFQHHYWQKGSTSRAAQSQILRSTHNPQKQ